MAFLRRDIDRRKSANVIVEFPAITAVFVAADAMHGKMPRLLITQMAILHLHARQSLFNAGIAFWRPATEATLLLEPVAEPRIDGFTFQIGGKLGRRTQSFDHRQPADPLRKHPGIAQG